MTVTQLEHADAFTDTLPATDTYTRLDNLFTERRRVVEQLEALDKRFKGDDWQQSDQRLSVANQLTDAEIRRSEVEAEIVKAAWQLVAEEAVSFLRPQRGTV